MDPYVPNDTELAAEVTVLRAEGQHHQQGIARLHARLLETHPGWAVSERRFRRVLKGVVAADAAAGASPAPASVSVSGPGALTQGQEDTPAPAAVGLVLPTSRIMEGLDVARWTRKVRVRWFSRFKGKGLVATERIEEGEVVWKEDPFVIAPEWDIYDLQQSSLACAFCTTPFTGITAPALVAACQGAPACPARFCTLLCRARGARTHPLLCPVQNPASAPLLAFVRAVRWTVLHALAQCAARLLLATQDADGGAALEADWGVVRGFAETGLEDRWRNATWSPTRDGRAEEPDRAPWQKGHALFVAAFKDPPIPAERKKLARILKKPLREDIAQELFEHDAFLRGLGRVCLNLESHGGLYALHAHLNHSCAHNVAVRHLEQRTALARITVVARAAVAPGEELLISYADPAQGVRARRETLRAWGFGECMCARCVREAREEAEERARAEAAGEDTDMADLEMELKAGLGLA